MTASTAAQADGSPAPATGTEDWQQFAKYRGRILHHESVAKDMLSIIVEKPDGFEFTAGQGVDLTLDVEGWREKKSPMAIASLPHQRRLEFYIHAADGEAAVNREIAESKVGTRLLFNDANDMLRDEGPGVYIAGGAGLATFVAKFRDLDRRGEIEGNRLFLVNERRDEVFLQSEMFRLFGRSVTSTLTKQEHRDFEHGEIDREWIEKRVGCVDQPFYIAGPPSMTREIASIIEELGGTAQTIDWEGAIG